MLSWWVFLTVESLLMARIHLITPLGLQVFISSNDMLFFLAAILFFYQ